MHEYLRGICICFSYACHIPIELNGFHNEGRVPPSRYGGGRSRLHQVRWECGKRRKNICKCLSNIRAFRYLVYFMIFSLRCPWSYLFSGICSSDLFVYFFNVICVLHVLFVLYDVLTSTTIQEPDDSTRTR